MVKKSPDEIINDVCKILNLDVDKVLSYHNEPDYCDARCIIADILYKKKRCNYLDVSRILKKKYAAMSFKAIKKCKGFLEYDQQFKEKYQRVMTVLND